MANFGVKTTDLGSSNFSGYIQQGVVDKGKAMDTAVNFKTVSDVGNFVNDTYQAYDKYKTLKQVSETVGEVINEQEDRSLAGQQAARDEKQRLEQEQADTEKALGYDGTYPTMLNANLSEATRGIQNSLAEKTDKLTMAREQGVMDDFEMQERLKKITREAITNNPAYASEIVAHVTNVAEMNNLTARIKQDADTLKARQAASDAEAKRLLTLASSKDYQIDIYGSKYQLEDGSMDMNSIAADVSTRTQKLNQDRLVEESVKGNTEQYKINAQEFIANGWQWELNSNTILGAKNRIISILDGQGDRVAKVSQIQQIKGELLARNRKFYAMKQIPNNDPEIEAAHARLEAQLEVLEKAAIEGDLTGQRSKEIFKNLSESMVNQTKYDMYDRNPTLVDDTIMLEIFKNLDMPLNTFGRVSEITNRILESATRTETSSSDPVKATKNSKDFQPISGLPGGKNVRGLVTDAAVINAYTTKQNYEKVDEEFNKSLNTYQVAEGSDKAYATQSIVKSLNNTALDANVIGNLSGGTIGKAKTMLTENANGPIRTTFKNFTDTNPNIKFEIRQSDGKMIILNPTSTAASRFTANELRTINENFSAYHKVSGNSNIDKSVQEFYGMVYGEGTVIQRTEKAPVPKAASNTAPASESVATTMPTEEFNRTLKAQFDNAEGAPANDMVREDGTTKSDTGYLGVIKSNTGKDMTEFSVGVPIDGKETLIPTLVPGLTQAEINILKTEPNPKDIPKSIMDKAVAHAKKQIAEGKPIFFEKPAQKTKAEAEQELGMKYAALNDQLKKDEEAGKLTYQQRLDKSSELYKALREEVTQLEQTYGV